MESGKIRDQLVGHGRVYDIAGIRPIEGDDFNGVALFDGDGREFVHVVRSQGHHWSPGRQGVTGRRG